MVRRGAYKLIRHASRNEEVLFDLADDPGETIDLARVPEYRSQRDDLDANAARDARSSGRPRLTVDDDISYPPPPCRSNQRHPGQHHSGRRPTRFDANGVGLAVHDWGGDGPPVLLAHPTGFHGRIWAPVAARLVGRGRHVWSFDFRGHGDSDAPGLDDDSYSWHGFADDVLAVTRHLGLAGRDDLLACGHSKGGAALLLGEATARAPTRASGRTNRSCSPTSRQPSLTGVAPRRRARRWRHGEHGSEATQRVAVDRGGVRRRTRRSHRST